jgi:hypothetical protein
VILADLLFFMTFFAMLLYCCDQVSVDVWRVNIF